MEWGGGWVLLMLLFECWVYVGEGDVIMMASVGRGL